MKKTILHVIESLAVGGAEVLLTDSLKGMSDTYRHVLVYLHPPAPLLPAVKAAKVYCLGYMGKGDFFKSMIRLRRLIRQEQVGLVHTHHYWPTVLARFAKPANVPLLFTVHNLLSYDAFKLNRLSYYLEKISYSAAQHALFVSEAVKADYSASIGIRGKADVLYNFVDEQFYEQRNAKTAGATTNALRLIAVGSLKQQKNYSFLLEVFKQLQDKDIYLDIVGDGPLRASLEAAVEEEGLPRIRLRGESDKVAAILQNYDAFILASTYEGMSLAVIEAMAVGLPVLLSDIPSNREVAGSAAVYFSLSSPEDCARKIQALTGNQAALAALAAASKERALRFRKRTYVHALEAIYQQYL